MMRATLSLIAVLLCGGLAIAGPVCGQPGFGYRPAAAPVAVPVPVVVASPYYQVQYVQVPTVIAVAVNTDYAFSVQAYYASAIQLEALKQQTALLQAQRTTVGQPGGPVGVPVGQPAGAVMPQADAPPVGGAPPVTPPDLPAQGQGQGASANGSAPQSPGSGTPQTAAPGGADPRLVAVLQASCVRCHGGAQGTKGGVNLTNPNNLPAAVRLESYRQVRKGTMPKSAAPLRPEEIELFVDWIAAAAKK